MTAAVPPRFLVLGVIGPDSFETREAHRTTWVQDVKPAVDVRFVVSLRDRSDEHWRRRAGEVVEPDVDFVDSLGQSAGPAVVILSLFDAWLRHAVARYLDVTFIGRADSDTVPSPSWLLSVLAGQVERPRRHAILGTMHWYHWDRVRFRPWGWGMGPRFARWSATRDSADLCGGVSMSSERCSGPFPFAIGPLLLLSSPLVRMYAASASTKRALVDALSSRVNLSSSGSVGDARVGGGSSWVGSFMQPSDMGDLEVRLFDDVFLGHELCMVHRAQHVSVVAFPGGTYVDFPCKSPNPSGCMHGLELYNWTVSGAPLLAHRIRRPHYIPWAFEGVRRAPFAPQRPHKCQPINRTFDIDGSKQPGLPCGQTWEWCFSPMENSARAIIKRAKCTGKRCLGRQRAKRQEIRALTRQELRAIRCEGSNCSGVPSSKQ